MKRNAIIIDIDGTLIMSGKDINKPLIDMILRIGAIYKIILVSYRKETQRKRTVKQLSKFGIPYTELILNKNLKTVSLNWTSQRFKETVLNSLEEKYEIKLAIDNNDEVIKMYQRHKIFCWKVISN